jgi:2-phospho-L-lactate guanylyltransferase
VAAVAILPIKSFARAKQRLAGTLPEGPRRALAEAMFIDVLIALRRTAGLSAIVVVSGERPAQRTAAGHGARVVDDPAEHGQSAAAARGIAEALALGAERALLVPGDCPALDPGELEALLARPRASAPHALIVADRHGTGTNGLLLTPPDALAPAFGPGSLERHLGLARERGVEAELAAAPTLALDVDEPEDLAALQERFAATRGGGAHTRGLLNRLARATA